MNAFIELSNLLKSAGFKIVDFYNRPIDAPMALSQSIDLRVVELESSPVSLSGLLDKAGYEIIQYTDEHYEKEKDYQKAGYKGISLKIIKTVTPNDPSAPSENTQV